MHYLLAKGGGLLSMDDDKAAGFDSSDIPSEDGGRKIPEVEAEFSIVPLAPRLLFFM